MARKRANPARDALRSAGTAIRTQQALGAAAAVIAARTEMAALNPANPSAATKAEMSRMVSEKVEAFAKSGAAAAEGAQEAGRRSAEYALQGTAAASAALRKMAAARTGLEAALVQQRYVTDFLTRSFGFGIAMNALMVRTGENALRPVHRAVTSNEKRLRKKPR